MSMFNNWLAAFEKRTPSPLYGKPLMYLIGASNARAIPGSIVATRYGKNVLGDDKIAYCYLTSEGEWVAHLTNQFQIAAAAGYQFAELDNSADHETRVVQEAATMAHSHGLGIVASSPAFARSPVQIIAHPNVFGVIVERGGGTPATYEALRKEARKDGLIPVWFVFDGREGSQECADEIKAGGFKGMGVTYSTGEYTDSHTVLLPICA